MIESVSIVVAVLSFVVAALGFSFGVYQFRVRRRIEELQEIVQGEKETAAAAALRVRASRQPRMSARIPPLRRSYLANKRQVIEALFVAIVFHRSGRARSLIHESLKHQLGIDRALVVETADLMTRVVARSAGYTNLSDARSRLVSLRAELGLDDEKRTHIDVIELGTAIASREQSPCGCPAPVHQWSSLRPSLYQVGGLVLICKGEAAFRLGDVPILSLGYHRSVEGPLTSLGRRLVAEKYESADLHGSGRVDDIASRLASVVRGTPSLQGAPICAVPSSRLGYSEALADRIAELTGNPRIEPNLMRKDGSQPERSDIESKTVILVDDVLRTGGSYNAARTRLLRNGATHVTGLVGTCTVSRFSASCVLEDNELDVGSIQRSKLSGGLEAEIAVGSTAIRARRGEPVDMVTDVPRDRTR